MSERCAISLIIDIVVLCHINMRARTEAHSHSMDAAISVQKYGQTIKILSKWTVITRNMVIAMVITDDVDQSCASNVAIKSFLIT